jgi:hypothetical protein
MMRSEFESILTNIKERPKVKCLDFKSEVIVTLASIVTGIVEYAEKNDANTIILDNGGLNTKENDAW